MGVQISDFELGDDLTTAINLNLTVGSASAPMVAAPGLNSTVVTVRSAQSVADIVKYNLTSCMVSFQTFPGLSFWTSGGPLLCCGFPQTDRTEPSLRQHVCDDFSSRIRCIWKRAHRRAIL